MGRKSKYSKEFKIQACIDYDEGKGSLLDISKEIGVHNSIICRWYLRYKEHGCSAFDESNSNRSSSNTNM